MAKLKYDKDTFPKLVEEYARSGLYDKEIYANLGISHNAFYKYMAEYDEFNEAYQRGKERSIVIVENELFKNCLEREVKEVTVEKMKVGDGDEEVTKIKEVTKVVLGNTNAQKFWLACNSDKWRRSNLPPAEEEKKEVLLTAEQMKEMMEQAKEILKDLESNVC